MERFLDSSHGQEVAHSVGASVPTGTTAEEHCRTVISSFGARDNTVDSQLRNPHHL